LKTKGINKMKVIVLHETLFIAICILSKIVIISWQREYLW